MGCATMSEGPKTKSVITVPVRDLECDHCSGATFSLAGHHVHHMMKMRTSPFQSLGKVSARLIGHVKSSRSVVGFSIDI